MSAAVALQDLIVATLEADAAVWALVGARIYDNAPVGVAYPYISLGPSGSIEDDADCIDAEVHDIQIDVWTQDSGSQRGCKVIMAAVASALHGAELSMPGTEALVSLTVGLCRAIPDPSDGVAHGIIEVEAQTES
ncbi:DUF3168 domain-containing protein [Frigidibacter sp. MR17.24]|uniref:DUF3168 domain-containing protein n=1 Tax=Frigidibacter sp. MR17.24 TaxID=3127345 RepID=UPI0030130B6A